MLLVDFSGAGYRLAMSRVRGVPLCVRAGLLLGTPFALVLSAAVMVDAHLLPSCSTGRQAVAANLLGIGSVAVVAAGAGWWASRGVRLWHGFLAGVVVGIPVAVALLALPLLGLVPLTRCGTPPAASSVAPPLSTTSIEVQSAVSFVVEVILLAGVYGLAAAAVRSGRRRRR